MLNSRKIKRPIVKSRFLTNLLYSEYLYAGRKILLAGAIVFASTCVNAQNGLENIIVETYYISDANDTNANIDGGVLPVGSVTYRIYADMLPGYKFQAGYGLPGHEMRIETTTLFFNNEDRGSTSPTFNKSNLDDNTLMIDSWLSVGMGCNGHFGVRKAVDNGVATVVNSYSPMVLQSANPLAGIPLTQEDGLVAGAPEQVTAVGISTEIGVFADQNDGTNGPVFSSTTGSWACLVGCLGADTALNEVLIAQITTDGVLCFELNIQIGTPNGGVENYVAQNPTGSEILFAPLNYCSPVSSINSSEINNLFKIYPNPANDYTGLQVKLASSDVNNSYTIYDIAGKAVASKVIGAVTAGQIEKVDLSDLENGYYMLSLVINGATATQKIIKN